jgi:hypothetical protein
MQGLRAKLREKVKDLGEDFREVQYKDPVCVSCKIEITELQEINWVRSGLYIAVIVIFVLAFIGIFAYKFKYPGTVSERLASPTNAQLKDLHDQHSNGEIFQLYCPCTESFSMEDAGIDGNSLDFTELVNICYEYSDGTKTDGDLFPASKFKNICSGTVACLWRFNSQEWKGTLEIDFSLEVLSL